MGAITVSDWILFFFAPTAASTPACHRDGPPILPVEGVNEGLSCRPAFVRQWRDTLQKSGIDLASLTDRWAKTSPYRVILAGLGGRGDGETSMVVLPLKPIHEEERRQLGRRHPNWVVVRRLARHLVQLWTPPRDG